MKSLGKVLEYPFREPMPPGATATPLNMRYKKIRIDIQVYTTFHLNQTFYTLCHPERSEGSPYSVWCVVSGRKGVKKRPVTTWIDDTL